MNSFLRRYPWKERWKERQEELRREAQRGVAISIRDIPLITCSLVLVNTLVFIIVPQVNFEGIVLHWGFTPNNITQLDSLPTFITHMFLHADILHLFFNMFIFFQFGFLCEHRVGRYKLLLIYFVSGIFGALIHALFNQGSKIPTIGASGAVFGVLASYALLYPERPLYLMWGHMPVKVPSILGVAFVFLLETIYAFIGINPYIARTAHLGGGIGGVIMTAVIFPKESIQILSDIVDAFIDALIPTVPEQQPEHV